MKHIINILIFITLFFATLDGLRDTFLRDNPISYLKEISSFVLFLLLSLNTYRNGIKINSSFYIICNLFVLLLVCLSFVTTKYASAYLTRGTLSFGGWSVWIKLMSFYFLMNALFLLRLNYSDLYYRIPRIYIYLTLGYCSITMFFIATGLNSHLVQRNWSGRLSIGYPTMDSLILIVAIIFSIYFLNNKFAKILSITTLFLVLIMQNTASGYMMLFILMICSILFLKRTYKILSILLISGVCVLGFYIYNYWYINMGDYGVLLVDKINGFILGSDTSSIEIRQQQIQILMNDMNSYVLYSMLGKCGGEAYLVENTYYALYGFIGILGVLLFFTLFIFIFLRLPKSFSQGTYYSHSIIITVVYLISCAGLIGFYLYPMIFILAYLVSTYSFKEDSHEFVLKVYNDENLL